MAQIYIAGIHTDTGKTHFSALFCKAFSYGYFKLIQAGEIEDRDFIRRFVPECEVFDNGISLRTAASPHIAKLLEQRDYKAEQIFIPNAQNLAIELAGGLFTPLDDKQCSLEYLYQNPKPCILVGRYYLGCINHILLSAHALKAHNIPLLCVAMMADSHGDKGDELERHRSGEKCSDDYIDEFLQGHSLLQGVPLVRTHFFTQDSFASVAQNLAINLALLRALQGLKSS